MVCCKCCQGYATLCRVFSYGWFIGAVVLSCFAVASCEFITRDGASIGLFGWQPERSDECIAYRDMDDWDYGWLHDWARVSAILSPLLGILAIVLMITDCCCDICCNKYIETFLIVCCQLNQAFTFLIYASSACLSRQGGEFDTIFFKGCRFASGSAMSLAAFWLYFIGGFFLCCSPKPDRCCNKDDEEEGDKKGCCAKEKKEKEPKAAAAAATAAQEDKQDEEAPAVVPVPVKKEEEKMEEPEQVEQQEAPVVVPVPVPADAPRTKTPPPKEAGMELEYDGEFGTSQVGISE